MPCSPPLTAGSDGWALAGRIGEGTSRDFLSRSLISLSRSWAFCSSSASLARRSNFSPTSVGIGLPLYSFWIAISSVTIAFRSRVVAVPAVARSIPPSVLRFGSSRHIRASPSRAPHQLISVFIALVSSVGSGGGRMATDHADRDRLGLLLELQALRVVQRESTPCRSARGGRLRLREESADSSLLSFGQSPELLFQLGRHAAGEQGLHGARIDPGAVVHGPDHDGALAQLHLVQV